MERAIIRTPLEPFQTLMDDPLRALRVVRFAAKMESRIVPELADCIKNPQLHVKKKLMETKQTNNSFFLASIG